MSELTEKEYEVELVIECFATLRVFAENADAAEDNARASLTRSDLEIDLVTSVSVREVAANV